ncbi:carbohydrate binding domain-containing protein [Tolypothrix sp. FACHB-123]|uniref:carbohydrate binding domain-containing protein n=1 Tax=Tolypothrix sp. FACHB-123 TaxID=2692868 RepID=UPI0016871470|nr:carbohydrate binding domain-containing protein [Tolypothrix sp. FACHB-123]MBD2356457.1 carbohydrate binding domain-containing protein [Tolypothrix sp. FACHB-123]
MTSKQFALGTVALFITIGIIHDLGSAKVAATCPTPLLDGDFEEQISPKVSSPWVAEGNTAVDLAIGNSNSGQNNISMRNINGWNGISQRLKLQPNTEYELKAYVRTSENVTDGSFGVRDANQKSFVEIKFGRLPQYLPLTLRFVTGNESEYHIVTGFWAIGQDSWVQVDNYTLTGGTCKQEQQGIEGQGR